MSAAADSHRLLPSARVLLAVGSGLAVLMSGYVALLLFWRVGANPAGVPGFFHYPDATWGDGLLLPVLALCLQLLIGRLPKTSRRWPTWIATAAGAARQVHCLYLPGGLILVLHQIGPFRRRMTSPCLASGMPHFSSRQARSSLGHGWSYSGESGPQTRLRPRKCLHRR